MATRAAEIADIRRAPGRDPTCATCRRRPDRRYHDEIWAAAKARYQHDGSATVVIRPAR